MHLKSIIYWLIFLLACGKKDVSLNQNLPKEATVLISQLRLRITPNTQSAEIARLEKGEIVKILARSREKMRVGKEESFWYEVETQEGIRGWVYGAYLDIEGKAEKTSLDLAIPKINEYLVGRWYVEKAKGGLTEFFITFYPNGQFDCGQGKNILAKGNYELSPTEDNKAKVSFSGETTKNPVSELFVELRGQTLIVQGKWNEQIVKFQLTEKNPQPIEDESEKSP